MNVDFAVGIGISGVKFDKTIFPNACFKMNDQNQFFFTSVRFYPSTYKFIMKGSQGSLVSIRKKLDMINHFY